MSRRSRGQTKYKKQWQDEFFWVQSHQTNHFMARCILCKCEISVQSMGIQALRSHNTGKKHQEMVKTVQTTLPIKKTLPSTLDNLYSDQPKDSQAEMSKTSSDDPLGQHQGGSSNGTGASLLNRTTPLSDCTPLSVPHSAFGDYSKNIMQSFLKKEETVKSEMLLCLQTVMSHRSLRVAETDIKLIKLIFPDSNIAQNMKLSKTKIAYAITYGLGPHFSSELVKSINCCNHIVVGFDESLNKFAQAQQMDINVRFWDSLANGVKNRYLTSVFLHRGTANDLSNGLKKGLDKLDTNKILQLSMDGPNVNFKLLRNLKEELRGEKDDPQLLEIGSCGIHTLHCAFKGGITATKWHLIEFLRALYNFFKDSPARRGNFIETIGCSQFPLKFCATRWLENAPVAQRCLQILPFVQKYIDSFEKRPKNEKPTSKTFLIIQEAVRDELIRPKIAFFETVARDVELFLKEFQKDEPLAPFIYSELCQIIKNVSSRFVKQDILDTTPIQDINYSNADTLKTAKDVDVGYGTQQMLGKCKTVSKKDILLFKQDCRTCLQVLIKKLLDRSPLKYNLTKNITCLNPEIIVSNANVKKLLNATLQTLVEKNILMPQKADSIDREFSKFIVIDHNKSEMKAYSRHTKRLDHFWMELLGSSGEYSNLKYFVKLILILSHGNAAVERGFSVNKECIVENQKEVSLIAQRHIFDGVSEAGGILKIEVTKPMIHSYKNSHGRYIEALEQQRKKEAEKNKELQRRKEMVKEVKDLEKKQISLDAQRNMLVEELEKKKRDLKQ